MSRWYLNRLGPNEETIRLKIGDNVIGRQEDNDIIVQSLFSSRTHCIITVTDDNKSVIIKDLGTRNGTYINSTIYIDKIITLQHNDVVGIGCLTTYSPDPRYFVFQLKSDIIVDPDCIVIIESDDDEDVKPVISNALNNDILSEKKDENIISEITKNSDLTNQPEVSNVNIQSDISIVNIQSDISDVTIRPEVDNINVISNEISNMAVNDINKDNVIESRQIPFEIEPNQAQIEERITEVEKENDQNNQEVFIDDDNEEEMNYDRAMLMAIKQEAEDLDLMFSDYTRYNDPEDHNTSKASSRNENINNDIIVVSDEEQDEEEDLKVESWISKLSQSYIKKESQDLFSQHNIVYDIDEIGDFDDQIQQHLENFIEADGSVITRAGEQQQQLQNNENKCDDEKEVLQELCKTEKHLSPKEKPSIIKDGALISIPTAVIDPYINNEDSSSTNLGSAYDQDENEDIVKDIIFDHDDEDHAKDIIEDRDLEMETDIDDNHNEDDIFKDIIIQDKGQSSDEEKISDNIIVEEEIKKEVTILERDHKDKIKDDIQRTSKSDDEKRKQTEKNRQHSRDKVKKKHRKSKDFNRSINDVIQDSKLFAEEKRTEHDKIKHNREHDRKKKIRTKEKPSRRNERKKSSIEKGSDSDVIKSSSKKHNRIRQLFLSDETSEDDFEEKNKKTDFENKKINNNKISEILENDHNDSKVNRDHLQSSDENSKVSEPKPSTSTGVRVIEPFHMPNRKGFLRGELFLNLYLFDISRCTV